MTDTQMAEPASTAFLRDLADELDPMVTRIVQRTRITPELRHAVQSAHLRALADVLERITPEGVAVLEMAVGNLPQGFCAEDAADDAAASATLVALRLLLPPK